MSRGEVYHPPGGFNGQGRSVASEERKTVMKRLRELLGSEEMNRNGGIWSLRLREDPDGLRGLIGDLEDRIRAGKSPRHRAAWCEKVWRDCHAHSVRNPVPE